MSEWKTEGNKVWTWATADPEFEMANHVEALHLAAYLNSMQEWREPVLFRAMRRVISDETNRADAYTSYLEELVEKQRRELRDETPS